MNYKILLIALFTLSVVSCTTAYKAGQTPDDVYYSPVTESKYTEKKQDKEREEYYSSNDEDRYLRMKVRDRVRWGRIDDFDYWYDSRYDHCYCNCYNPYQYNIKYPGNLSWGNTYYNGWHPGWGTGYGQPIRIVRNVRVPSNVNRPMLGGYKNDSYNNSNLSNSIKKVFSGNSGYNNSNTGTDGNSSPSRTYNPSSSSGSSSSGSSRSSGSSSGGSVSRPSRGGN